MLGALQQHGSTAAAARSNAAATKNTAAGYESTAAATGSNKAAYMSYAVAAWGPAAATGSTAAAAYDDGAPPQLQQLLGAPQQLMEAPQQLLRAPHWSIAVAIYYMYLTHYHRAQYLVFAGDLTEYIFPCLVQQVIAVNEALAFVHVQVAVGGRLAQGIDRHCGSVTMVTQTQFAGTKYDICKMKQVDLARCIDSLDFTFIYPFQREDRL